MRKICQGELNIFSKSRVEQPAEELLRNIERKSQQGAGFPPKTKRQTARTDGDQKKPKTH